MTRKDVASIRAEYHNKWLSDPKLVSLTRQCLDEAETHVGEHAYPDNVFADKPRSAKCSVVNTSTVTAALSVQGRTGILNFASARHPGGGYLDGARAQEEALCHSSNLYEILSDPKCADFYAAKKPSGLYTSDYIYTPVAFILDADDRPIKPRKFDVMTIAAPNLSARAQYDTHASVPPEAVQQALDERIWLTLSEFIRHGCVNVILGAFGCGVFGNDPSSVAGIFRDWLITRNVAEHFDNIVFAVFDTTPDKRNYNAFKRVFG